MNKISYLVLPLILSGCAFFSSEKAVQYNKDFNCNINAPIFTQFYNREDLIKKDDLWYDKNEKIVSGIAILPHTDGNVKFCTAWYYKNGKLKKVESTFTGKKGVFYKHIDTYNDNKTYISETIDKFKTTKELNEIKDDEKITYFENGQIKSNALYKNKKRDIEISYYPTGETFIIEQFMPNDCRKITKYFKNGKKKSVGTYSYIYEKNGTFEHYTPLGKMHLTQIYKDNMLNGKSTFYYTNNTLKAELNYKNDIFNGPFNAYDKNGDIIFSAQFKNGNPISGYCILSDNEKKYFSQDKINNTDIKNVEYTYLCNDLYSFYDGTYINEAKQSKLEKILENNIKKYKAIGGSYILMDSDTGQILSMSSQGKNKINYNLDYAYEPGTVLQTLYLASGLENKVINKDSTFDVSKPLVIDGLSITDTSKHSKNKSLIYSLEDNIRYSSNIASAQLAMMIGAKKQDKFFNNIRFFDNLRTDKSVSISSDIYFPTQRRMAINSYGFGIETTPLHLISAYNAILNGGIYKYPYFQKQNNFEEKRVISNDNSKLIKSILRKNVKEGTARFADIPNINTYFKTGTANKKNDKGKYEDKKVRTTVIGGFTYKNKNYTMFVLLDEPQPIEETYNFYTSGWNAVPTAKELIEKIINY